MLSLINLQIAGFRNSMLCEFSDCAPWELTARALEIVRKTLNLCGQSYNISGDVAVHGTSIVEAGAIIKGPAIIGPGCFIAAGAYLRGGCWLDENCVVGPGSELKSSFVFRGSKLAHLNFVGDSILGSEVNLEAGSIIANYRNELGGPVISFTHNGQVIRTDVTKFGALVGDGTKIGANAVVAPGAVLPPDTIVKRLASVDHGVK
jgi:UDP-N-acetylglucosamine diphosphorylase / glucose-1-phosphate thymidylyltransferase / UDP-N-acetylgalactosamine diphosphorylase / glucosamine-1-phosphate N-acetyltransferase / galactosamine-1-phosphate N-acetyltransferase